MHTHNTFTYRHTFTHSLTLTHSHLSLVPSSLGLRLHVPGPSVGGLSPGSHTSTQEASPSSCGRGKGRTWLPATLTHTHSTPLTAGTPGSSSLWGSRRDDQTTAGSSGSPAAAGKPWQQHDYTLSWGRDPGRASSIQIGCPSNQPNHKDNTHTHA